MGWKVAMGGKAAGVGGEKLRCPPSSAMARSRKKLWMVRATMKVLLWTCIVQLTAVGDTWGPRVLKGWPSCLTAPEEAAALAGARPASPEPVVEKATLPPKSGSVSSRRAELYEKMARDLDERGATFLKGGETSQSLTLSDLFDTRDSTVVPKLKAADPPVRANVLYLDPEFAAVISKAVKEVFLPYFDQVIWFQNTSIYHFSMFHASHHLEPIIATEDEIEAEADSVKRVTETVCPLKIVLDRVVLTTTGVLLGLWQSVVQEEWTAEVFDGELMRYPNIEEMVEMLQIGMSCVSRTPERRPKMSDVVRMIEEVGRNGTGTRPSTEASTPVVEAQNKAESSSAAP